MCRLEDCCCEPRRPLSVSYSIGLAAGACAVGGDVEYDEIREAAAVIEEDLRLDALGLLLRLEGLEGPAIAPCPNSLSSVSSTAAFGDNVSFLGFADPPELAIVPLLGWCRQTPWANKAA